MRITDEQIKTLRKQGFVFVENFLSEEEQSAALEDFFNLYAPSYEDYIASGRDRSLIKNGNFPFDGSGLNYVASHPDIIDAAERIYGTREVRISSGGLGMKYAGEKFTGGAQGFHQDFSSNTLGPNQEPDDFMNLHFFFYFDDVKPGMAPIVMVPNGKPDSAGIPMIAPKGSLCIYSMFTRHSATDFTAPSGHRAVMWGGLSRKDRMWDGGEFFNYKVLKKQGRDYPELQKAMKRFITEASPRQLELLGFPQVGDALWDEKFIQGMVNRYEGFNPQPYLDALRK